MIEAAERDGHLSPDSAVIELHLEIPELLFLFVRQGVQVYLNNA